MSLLVGTRRALLGGGGFDPRRLGDLKLWLNAYALTGLADAAAVTDWGDWSASGLIATQATAGRKPTFRATGLNGRPIVRFDGGDTLITGALDLTACTGLTLVYVAKSSVSAAQTILSLPDNASGVTTGFVSGFRSSGEADVYIKGNLGQAYTYTVGTIGTTPHVVIVIADKTLATQENKIWLDGDGTDTFSVNENSSNNTFGNHPVSIGSQQSLTLCLTGDVSEIMLFGRAFSAADRSYILAATQSGWGF